MSLSPSPTRVACLLLHLGFSAACSNFIASGGATKDGSTQLGYNSDGQSFYGYMEHYPAGDHSEGEQRDIWEFGTGRYMGSIPEASHTYNVIGMMNEHQLSIGETTFDGVWSLGSQPGAKIDYYSLIWITLQRAKTAREAIMTMDMLTREHGYASTGESFSLIDPEEAWVMDFIGRGPGESGAVWVARRIPDDYVGAHANQARITTFPRDSNDTLYSHDIVDFAKRKGLYPADGSDEDFSFADVFDPVTPIGARLCEARVWDLFSRVAEPGFADRYLDYAQGKNLSNRMPLFVKAEQQLNVNDTMWLMRSHYEGTWFDAEKDEGFAPFHTPYRTRPLVFRVKNKVYSLNRNVGYLGTFFHFVSQARGTSFRPKCAGGLTWFGVDDASLSVRAPMYSCTSKAPETYAYGNGDTGHYERRAAYWAFNVVANFAYSRWDLVGTDVQQRVARTEERLLQEVADADREAANKLRKGTSEAEVAQYLSGYSVRVADSLVDNWVDLFPELFVRYRDGLVCPPSPPPPDGKDRPGPPWCRSVGYDDAWYERLVQETGDRYLIPESASDSLAELSLQKLATANAGIGAALAEEHIHKVSLADHASKRPSRSLSSTPFAI